MPEERGSEEETRLLAEKNLVPVGAGMLTLTRLSQLGVETDFFEWLECGKANEFEDSHGQSRCSLDPGSSQR